MYRRPSTSLLLPACSSARISACFTPSIGIKPSPGTHDVAARIDDDSADISWIGRSETDALARQVKRAMEKLLVG